MNIDAAPGVTAVSRYDFQNPANAGSAECLLLAVSSRRLTVNMHAGAFLGEL